MTETNEANEPLPAKPIEQSKFKTLRIWPAVLILLAMLACKLAPVVVPDATDATWMVAGFGPFLGGVALLIWWLTFSRSTWQERLLGLIVIVGGAAMILGVADKSMRGPGAVMLTVPMGMTVFGIATVLFSQLLTIKRTVIALLLTTIGFGYSALIRHDGVWGDFGNVYNWRWTKTQEDLFLAERGNPILEPVSHELGESFAAAIANPEWPGFRGADRSAIYRGPAISSDWDSHEPELIWKVSVGPGWTSFVVAGELLITQEQRGDEESVVCYDADTGEEVWIYSIKSRFEESLGGPGPRATPTLVNGQLFAYGANGNLVRLDPKTGARIWEAGVAKLAERRPPSWGFSSSPLVVGSSVIVHAGGTDDKGVFAFDVETGQVNWRAASGDHTYSSPQLSAINGNEFVVMLTNKGAEVLDPETGEIRLSYSWNTGGYRALQPTFVSADSFLLPTDGGNGIRCVRITSNEGEMEATEVWTKTTMKTDFNDMVFYKDHLYGFDGAIFSCINAQTGERAWKGGRYGKGQVLLLENSGLLLVASEKGDAVLIKPDPSGHQEVAKFRAIEGKTWNHPVVVGDRLFIRNGQQAACYRLPLVVDE
jgi:hypothetical protein